MKPLLTVPAAKPSPARRGIALAACAFVLPLAEDGMAWVQLLPAGSFRAVDGRPTDAPHWFIDSATAAQVIARSQSRQTLAVVDYEHQTLKKDENGQPAPAAGWLLDMEWREGSGLWGKVFFTERARAQIKAGEYRYFSPVFSYDRQGTVLNIEMGALTNHPALDGLAPLSTLAALEQRAAACLVFLDKGQAPEDRTMDKALLKALGLPEGADTQAAMAALNQLKAQQAAQSQTLTALKKALNVADEGELLAACSQLTAQPDPAQFVPMEVVNALTEQVAALSAEVSGSAVDRLVNQALADGRLLPAMEGWARDYGQKNRAGLEAFLKAAAPLAALTRLQASQAPKVDDGLSLSADERKAAELLGLCAKDLATAKGV